MESCSVVGVLRSDRVVIRLIGDERQFRTGCGARILIGRSNCSEEKYDAEPVAPDQWDTALTELLDKDATLARKLKDRKCLGEYKVDIDVCRKDRFDSVAFEFVESQQVVGWLSGRVALSHLCAKQRNFGVDLIVKPKTRLLDSQTLAYVSVSTFESTDAESFLRLNALVVLLYKHAEGFAWLSGKELRSYIYEGEQIASGLRRNGTSSKTDGLLVLQSIRMAGWHAMIRANEMEEVSRLLADIRVMRFDHEDRPVYALNRSKSLMLSLAAAIAQKDWREANDLCEEIFALFYEAASRYTESVGWFGDFRWVWENAYIARQIKEHVGRRRAPPERMLRKAVLLSLRSQGADQEAFAWRYLTQIQPLR